MMSVSSAVTFTLLRARLERALPRSVRDGLSTHFRRAEQVLRDHPMATMASWPRKVRALPRGYPLMTPEVKGSVLDAVYRALLEDWCLDLRCRKRGTKEARRYEVHPLGLVDRQGVLVLVATVFRYEDPLHFMLHRVEEAEVVDKRAQGPQGFDLDAHIAAA